MSLVCVIVFVYSLEVVVGTSGEGLFWSLFSSGLRDGADPVLSALKGVPDLDGGDFTNWPEVALPEDDSIFHQIDPWHGAAGGPPVRATAVGEDWVPHEFFAARNRRQCSPEFLALVSKWMFERDADDDPGEMLAAWRAAYDPGPVGLSPVTEFVELGLPDGVLLKRPYRGVKRILFRMVPEGVDPLSGISWGSTPWTGFRMAAGTWGADRLTIWAALVSPDAIAGHAVVSSVCWPPRAEALETDYGYGYFERTICDEWFVDPELIGDEVWPVWSGPASYPVPTRPGGRAWMP